MSEQYKMSSDYVDIHGESLNVLIRSDGTLFVPFNEIRKTGFHIFPKKTFEQSNVSKNFVSEEFRYYLMGAAREFLIQKNIGLINNEEIQKTIEECRDKLTGDISKPTNKSPVSVLGRTLLMNPADVNQIAKAPIVTAQLSNKTENYGDNNQNTRRNISRPNLADHTNQIRLPHYQNDNSNQTTLNDDNRKSNMKSAFIKRQQQQRNNNLNQNEQNRHTQNNGKISTRRNSDSKSTSESEDGPQQYIKFANFNVKRIELKKDVQEVKVVHKEVSHDKFKYWVQLVENEKKVLDIIEKCYEIADDAPIVKPKLNEMYLAHNKEDDLWYRVIVFRLLPVIKVHFVDFGNDAVVSEVRELPDELKSIPAQAARMLLSNCNGAQPELEIEEVLSVQYVKQFEDSTYIVTKSNKKPAQSQKTIEPVLINKIKYSTALTANDVVKIISHCNGKLYLRNREHHEKLAEVDVEIRHLQRHPVDNVVPNQLVLSKKEGSEEKLSRAIVKKVENNKAIIHFMDYYMDDEVLVKNLFCAEKKVASLPATLIETPVLKGFSSAKFDDNAASLLDEMVMNNVKFNVATGDMEFDLLLRGKSLSEMLFPNTIKTNTAAPVKSTDSPVKSTISPVKSTISPVKLTSTPSKVEKSEDAYVKVMYEDMQTYEPPMGKGDYMLTNFKDCTDFTVTSTGDRESELLSQCTCIDVTDPIPYEPSDSEMVLACFDGGWYRALVFDVSDSGVYQVMFVEYGNMVEVTAKDIRKFPKEFRSIPILGLSCQMQVKDDEEVKRRLEKLIEPDNIYEINFLSYSVDNLQYTVEIPKIKEILIQEGLM